MTVRLGAGEEVDGIDEEFLFHLNKGTDLLARGEADAARASLERALELRPKDVKVLGLLGQPTTSSDASTTRPGSGSGSSTTTRSSPPRA